MATKNVTAPARRARSKRSQPGEGSTKTVVSVRSGSGGSDGSGITATMLAGRRRVVDVADGLGRRRGGRWWARVRPAVTGARQGIIAVPPQAMSRVEPVMCRASSSTRYRTARETSDGSIQATRWGFIVR
jgi:hypothetical protein